MGDWTKLRAERRLLSVDFAADLPTGATIASAAEPTFTRGGTAVTTQFRDGEDAPTVDGTEVQFWTIAATGDNQPVGDYTVRLTVTLSTGEVVAAASSDGVPPVLTVKA